MGTYQDGDILSNADASNILSNAGASTWEPAGTQMECRSQIYLAGT